MLLRLSTSFTNLGQSSCQHDGLYARRVPDEEELTNFYKCEWPLFARLGKKTTVRFPCLKAYLNGFQNPLCIFQVNPSVMLNIQQF